MSGMSLDAVRVQIENITQRLRDPMAFTEQQRVFAMNKLTALHKQSQHLQSLLSGTGGNRPLAHAGSVPSLNTTAASSSSGTDGAHVAGPPVTPAQAYAMHQALQRPGQAPGRSVLNTYFPHGHERLPQPTEAEGSTRVPVPIILPSGHGRGEKPESPEITAADFEAIERLEKLSTSQEKEDDGDEDMVVVEKEFQEKDMLCPYSGKVMQTPMKSRSCGHHLDRDSLKALVDYFSTKQKELSRKNKPTLSSNCPIYGCKGMWTHKTSVIDKELRTKIQQIQSNGGVESLRSGSSPGAQAASAGSSSGGAGSSPAAVAGGGAKRKAPEVLDLCSDSEDEEEQPPQKRPTAPTAATSSSPSLSSSSATTAVAAMPPLPTLQSQDGATTREASPSMSIPSSTPNGHMNGISAAPAAASSSSSMTMANGVAIQSPLAAFHQNEMQEELVKAKALRKQLTDERKSLEMFVTKRKAAKARAQSQLDDEGKLRQQLQTVQEDNQILQKIVLGLDEFVRAARERDNNEDA